jgi:RNA polymerase sigma-70 factor (ECF subfamily)
MPSTIAWTRARSAELRCALQALTSTDRELVLLVAWEGLTIAEAAAALRLRPATARSRLHRARIRAQAALETLPAKGDRYEATVHREIWIGHHHDGC